MLTIGKKLISNVAFLFLDWTTVAGFSFLFWLIAGKTLLPEQYGIVSTSVNFMALLSGISLLGLHSAVMKLIPEYLGRNQNKKVSGLIWFSLKVVIFINLILTILLLVFSSFFASLFKTTVQVIWIITAALLVHSLSNQFGYILQGFQKMKKIFITDFYGSVIKVLISAILIFIGLSYFGPLIGFTLSFLVISLSRWKAIQPKTNSKSIDKRYIIADYALPAFFAHLAWFILASGQYIILTILKNPEITGIFTVASLLSFPIVIINNVMASGLFPITSQLSVFHDSKKRQSYLIQLVFRYSIFFSLPAAIFLILFSKPIILIFSRPEYLSASELFPILVFASMINGCQMVFISSLYAIGKTRLNRNIAITTALIFLLLSVPLTQFFSAFGIALAYAVSITIGAILSYFFVKKNLELSLPWKNILKLIIATTISFSFLSIMARFTENLIIGIILTVIAALIYLAALIPLKFYTKEDVKIIEFVAEKSPILKKQLLAFSKNFRKLTG